MESMERNIAGSNNYYINDLSVKNYFWIEITMIGIENREFTFLKYGKEYQFVYRYSIEFTVLPVEGLMYISGT